MVLSPTSFRFAAPLSPHVAGGGTTRSPTHNPDWVLLHKSARISGHRNATTAAECHTMEGQPIQVSFWLVDPPGVSYFSVHCPGLDPKEFDLEPQILCADAALVLFSVDFVPVPGRTFRDPGRRCTQQFLYRAGPGKPSLHLVPDPDIVRPNGVYALLPSGADSDEHYAVVFLHSRSLPRDKARYYDLHVFSSVTRAWSSKGTLPGLSEDDQELLAQARHATYKVIKVGESSLGFVDLSWGILLVCDVLGECPVIKYVPLPASRVCNLDEDGEPYIAPDYCCDVSSCGSLIKFVEVEFDDRYRRSLGNQGWKATIWNRDVMSLDDEDWRVRSSVDVANISVDPSYSDLLPELWNDKTKELDLKKLVFCIPTLSNYDDEFLYVMSKLNCQDDKAWVISVDMEHASVEAIAPYSNKGCSLDASHCPCTFPKYLELTTPGDDVTMQFQRVSVADCVLHVLLAQDWFMKLDKRLEFERPTYDECKSLLNSCPVPSLLSDIEEVVKYVFGFHTGHCEAASKTVDSWSRALDDFVQSLSTEAMRSNLDVVLQGFKNLLLLVPPAVRVLADACHQKVKIELCEKPDHTKESKSEGFLDNSNLPHCKKPIVWVFARRKTIFKLEKTGQRKEKPLQGNLYANFPQCESTAWVLRRKGTFELEKIVQTEEKPRVYKMKKQGWCRKAKWDGRAVVPDRGAEWWGRLLYQQSRVPLLLAVYILAAACIWVSFS